MAKQKRARALKASRKLPVLARRFEWLVVLFLCVGAVFSIFRSGEWKDLYGDRSGLAILALIQVVSIAVNLTITYYITRKQSSIAKWAFICLMAWGLFAGLLGLFWTRSLSTKAAQFIIDGSIRLYMAYLLFTPELEKWLKRPAAKRSMSTTDQLLIFIGVPTAAVVMLVLLYRWALGNIPDSIYKEISEQNLKQSISAIEYYRQVNGSYPLKLEDLKGGKMDRESFLRDSSAGIHIHHLYHQYAIQPDGQHYTLFDVGADGVSGTADDIYPVIPVNEAGHIGYVKK